MIPDPNLWPSSWQIVPGAGKLILLFGCLPLAALGFWCFCRALLTLVKTAESRFAEMAAGRVQLLSQASALMNWLCVLCLVLCPLQTLRIADLTAEGQPGLLPYSWTIRAVCWLAGVQIILCAAFDLAHRYASAALSKAKASCA